MARSRTPKFDASEAITNEIIRIIERGVLPWRKPWTAGGSSRPLRVGGEPYQGVNNFLLTMRTVMAGRKGPQGRKILCRRLLRSKPERRGRR
jgi:antirestriction protein ArdC